MINFIKKKIDQTLRKKERFEDHGELKKRTIFNFEEVSEVLGKNHESNTQKRIKPQVVYEIGDFIATLSLFSFVEIGITRRKLL